MKIEVKDGPAVTQPAQAQASARDRAIAKLIQGNQAQTAPVANPTQVSPEELSAISPSSTADTAQNNNSDSTQSAPDSEVNKAAPPKADDPLSTQYALLARKEKALRAKVQAQEAATKAREQVLLAREEALKAKELEYQSNYVPKSRLKNDPLSVLTEEGVSYDEITKAILNPQAQQDPRIIAEIEKLKAEVKASRDAQTQAQKAYEDSQKQAYTQAVNQIRTEAKRLVFTDPEFETIKETGSVNDVVDLIEKTFQKDGVLLSVEEAAKEVEEYLVEEAIKLSKINKIKSRLQAAAPAAPAKQQTESKQPQQPQMKTLTNSVNATKKLSAKERAILAFKGELK